MGNAGDVVIREKGKGTMRSKSWWLRAAVVVPAMALGVAACGGGGSPSGSQTTTTAKSGSSGGSSTTSGGSSSGGSGSGGTLTIALQPDLGYAPLYIVEQEGWLKKALPNTTVKWQLLNSGSAIETGMITGHIDVGAGGIAPFLLGVNKGVGWKLLSSLDEQNLWLVCRPKIKSVKDISSTDHISVVAPTSIQAINVKKAAQKFLGNSKALDPNLVILSHPVSAQAFKAGRTTCALDAPPFEQEEVAAGGHMVTSSYQLFGTSTFNSTFVLPKFYQSHQQEMQTLVQQIKRAVNMLTNDPQQASQVIAAYEKGSLSQSAALKILTAKGTHWTTVPHGYMAYAKFMHSIGLISSVPSSMSAIEFPTLKATPGN